MSDTTTKKNTSKQQPKQNRPSHRKNRSTKVFLATVVMAVIALACACAWIGTMLPSQWWGIIALALGAVIVFCLFWLNGFSYGYDHRYKEERS